MVAFRERKKGSLWFRGLVENCVVYGDRGYRGCEGVIVCGSREMRSNRQAVEGVISQIKERKAFVENQYKRAVSREGNIKAQRLVAGVFELR